MADDLLTEDAPGGAGNHQPVPPECDVFTLSTEKIEKMLARGVDAHIRRVRIYRNQNGQKQRIPGEFDVSEVNTERVLRKYGPGRYEFQGLNENGQFLASSSHNLVHGFEEDDDDDQEAEDEYLPEMPAPAQLPSGMDPMLAFMMQQQQASNQMMMQIVVTAIGNNNRGGQSELAEAIAASTAASSQSLNGVANAMAANFAAQSQSPAAQGAAQTNSTLEKIVLALMAKDTAPQQNAQQNASELLLVLSQLKENDEGGSKMFWTEIFPTLIDGLGAPVLGAVAAAMPPDKGAILSELLQQHMRTREAEAKADAQPDTFDTTGTAAE